MNQLVECRHCGAPDCDFTDCPAKHLSTSCETVLGSVILNLDQVSRVLLAEVDPPGKYARIDKRLNEIAGRLAQIRKTFDARCAEASEANGCAGPDAT